MRIETSANYFDHHDCPLAECDKHYCEAHRLLWRDCDTAIKTWGGGVIYELDDCPRCRAEWRRRAHLELASRTQSEPAIQLKEAV